MNELTPDELRKWFDGISVGTVYIQTPGVGGGGRQVSKQEVQAYIQKLELRVMRLASKLADQD